MEWLNLDDSEMTTLEAGDFDDFTLLGYLNLDDKGLASLPPGIFDDLSNLGTLKLRDNGLTSLPEGVFDNLSALRTLELRSNNLTEFPDGIFDNLIELTYLSLGSNRIEQLPEGIFDSLADLTRLGLSGNEIEQLPNGIFDGLTSLESLYLSYNDIRELPDGAFNSLTGLVRLSLSSNSLTHVPSSVGSLSQLEYLNLFENSIESLSSDTFENLTSLTYLGLFGNRILEFPNGIFDNLQQLETLYLSNNRISELPEGVFEHLTNLEELSFSKNNLIELPDGLFEGLYGLRSIRAEHNVEDPFILTARLEQLGDNSVGVTIAEATPFSVDVTLAADRGSLSTSTVTIAAGSMSSESITVNPTGDDPVSVSVNSAAFLVDESDHISGIEMRIGRSLTLGEEIEANQVATGAPQITGIARVGEKLLASISTIADANGITEADFQYYWIRSDGTNEAYIGRSARRQEYRVSRGDVGKTVKVRVKFTDDAGYEETITSTATATVPISVPGRPPFVEAQASGTGELSVSWWRPSDGGSEITGYTVQWKEATGSWDTAADFSSATTTETAYTISRLSVGTWYAVRVFAINAVGNGLPTSVVPATKVLSFQTQNAPATGAPAISGTPRVDETLSADTSGIADEDGISSVSYSYQWVSNDGAADADISEAASSTYTLVSADVGKTIRVRVSFSDDAGNEETLTSTLTETVDFAVQHRTDNSPGTESSPIWSATMTAGLLYDGYGYSSYSGGAGQLSDTAFDLDGVAYTIKAVVAWGWMYIMSDRVLPSELTFEVDGTRFNLSDASLTTYSYGTEYRWSEAEINWSDGAAVKLQLHHVDAELSQETAADNNPATEHRPSAARPGRAYIDGGHIGRRRRGWLRQRGVQLQWVRNDGSEDADISGATATTYTLVDVDQGKT